MRRRTTSSDCFLVRHEIIDDSLCRIMKRQLFGHRDDGEIEGAA
jgi:hypothetical protein